MQPPPKPQVSGRAARNSWDLRQWIASSLSLVMVAITAGCGAPKAPPATPLTPAVKQPLEEALQLPYLTLFDEAPTLEFSDTQIKKMRQYEEKSRDYCIHSYEEAIDRKEKQLNSLQQELKRRSANLGEDERHSLHCRIQNTRTEKREAEVLANTAIPTAYDNRLAKLDLIEEWPRQVRQIRNDIQTGTYHSREFGDVKDIGFRSVGEGQRDDVERGRQAVEEMKRADLMPDEVENEAIVAYVENLTEKIARNSDLRVPAKITVLNGSEINAFALPGGFLFVQRGLLEATEDEAQLAGVIAHEIAHAAARHGHQLMKRATISQIIYQVAQVAAMVLTGGVAGIGTYYALQYGFYGLGLFLNLNLLGVSRDFELEADQLGVQYAWKSGYDPTGFIRFFDKMASEKGYVRGASWFRTHPPFYERMWKTKREIMYLPDSQDDLVKTTSEYEAMKQELKGVTQKAEEKSKDAPSLLAPEKGCPEPDVPDYEAGQEVRALCRDIERT